MKRALGWVLFVIGVLLLGVAAADAQSATNGVPTPTGSFNVSVGGTALGVMGSNAAPGTDIVASVDVKGNTWMRSDSILVPSTGKQIYTGSVQHPFAGTLLQKTNLKSLDPYVVAGAGIERVVPATGPSTAHVAVLAGGGLNWKSVSTGIEVNIVEVRWLRAGGQNNAVIAGGISKFFGKTQ